MKPRKSRDSVLMLVAMVCLAAYILACRPAFSPDGSRILFATWDQKTKRSSVIRFNRTTQEAEAVFIWKEPLLSVQWAPDGQGMLLTWKEGETRKVMIVPLGTRNPTRLFDLRTGNSGRSMLPYFYFPPLVVGNHLFLAEGNSVYRLNLETGDTKTLDFGGDGAPILNRHRNQVYFWTGSTREAVYEIGRIDTENLAPISILEIEAKDVGKLSPFLAISEDGSRFAIVSKKPFASAILEEPFLIKEQHRILIYNGKDLERTIQVGSESNPIALGNIEWSPDGATIYAAYARPVEAEGRFEFGVLEVPLTGASVRQIPLSRLAERPDPWLFEFQIARSPDGTTIAVACPHTDLFKGTDCALYLVDLESPDRKVTKIPVPLPPAPSKPIPEGG